MLNSVPYHTGFMHIILPVMHHWIEMTLMTQNPHLYWENKLTGFG